LMSHMIADNPNELHDMADRIGVARRWFQSNASAPHYDICRSKLELAIKGGAVLCDRVEFVGHLKRIKARWPRDDNGRWMLFGGDNV
jgi:hypothetical protein